MRILFTGASSFSGFWFAKAMADSGHQVICPFTKNAEAYGGIRRLRVRELVKNNNIYPLWNFRLDDADSVSRVMEFSNIKVICHHAAEVGDYKNQDFNPIRGAAASVVGMEKFIDTLANIGCELFVQTGTYFESGEGIEGETAAAFSPYAVSKSIAEELMRYHVNKKGMRFIKFVMPNPFGPFEERGFTWYFFNQILANKTPQVKTPDYIRDNMPVTVMAREYLQAVENGISDNNSYRKVKPSGYAMKQIDFVKIIIDKTIPLMGAYDVEFKTQMTFDEPTVRVNENIGHTPAWRENEEEFFWKEMTNYYKTFVRGEF